MIFSKTCQAALKSIAFLASPTAKFKKYSIKAVSKAVRENDHTLGKVLQVLVKHNFINSLKGPKGGFFIERKQLPIRVLKVVEALDGPFEFDGCVMGFNKCSEKKPCAFHEEFKKSRKVIHKLLTKSTIGDLGKTDNYFIPINTKE
jgi:Rrf2 family protein